MTRMPSRLQCALVMLASALAGGIAQAEDEACAQRANDKGLIGKERTLFVEECERVLREDIKPAPGAAVGKNRPDRRERDTSRERTSRDHGAAPVLTP